MKKIFISYSSKNQRLVEAFTKFLQLGMGMNKSDIFCTAYPDMLETGYSFIEKIRKNLQECETVISIITEEYLESAFCLVEMGAAWAMSKHYFPLVTVPYGRLNKTPLMGMQMRKLINIDDLSVIYDELHRCGVLEKYQTAEFHKQAKDYVKQAKKIVEGDYQIEKDEEGYYETEISCVRKVAQKQFRCYGIKGHIADPPDGENAKSDWLFYRIDQFPPLEAGDRVRFKTSKSKINAFPDLGRARNIYPDDLMKPD